MLHLNMQKAVLLKLQEKKKTRQAEIEKRKTSVRLLTFLMFGMPLCWMLFSVESGRECEGEISGVMPKLSLLQQIQSGTDLSFCPCSSHQSQKHMRKPCAERGRTCRDVD